MRVHHRQERLPERPRRLRRRLVAALGQVGDHERRAARIGRPPREHLPPRHERLHDRDTEPVGRMQRRSQERGQMGRAPPSREGEPRGLEGLEVAVERWRVRGEAERRPLHEIGELDGAKHPPRRDHRVERVVFVARVESPLRLREPSTRRLRLCHRSRRLLPSLGPAYAMGQNAKRAPDESCARFAVSGLVGRDDQPITWAGAAAPSRSTRTPRGRRRGTRGPSAASRGRPAPGTPWGSSSWTSPSP